METNAVDELNWIDFAYNVDTIEEMSIGIDIIETIEVKAVSYTHLDVYKRQTIV